MLADQRARDGTAIEIATVYYPFNGVPVATKQGDTLSYLHHDYLGSLVAATDTSGNELGWLRYDPFGSVRLSGGTLPTNRLFTGQPRDIMDDRLYFFQSRYYDSTIGKFFQADTISPRWANPQSLNPYAYALNSPLRLSDPTGHESMDPTWVARWEKEHPGQGKPTQQDWLDYQRSLQVPGTGPNGSWTVEDWFAYKVLRPLQQAEDWINDPHYSNVPAHLSLAYLERHAAALLQSYAVGNITSAAARAALHSWFASRRAEIDLVDRFGNTRFVSYRGLPRQGGEAATRLISELVGAMPFTGVDETTGATVFGAVTEYIGVGVEVGLLGAPLIGALVMYILSPATAESN